MKSYYFCMTTDEVVTDRHYERCISAGVPDNFIFLGKYRTISEAQKDLKKNPNYLNRYRWYW